MSDELVHVEVSVRCVVTIPVNPVARRILYGTSDLDTCVRADLRNGLGDRYPVQESDVVVGADKTVVLISKILATVESLDSLANCTLEPSDSDRLSELVEQLQEAVDEHSN